MPLHECARLLNASWTAFKLSNFFPDIPPAIHPLYLSNLGLVATVVAFLTANFPHPRNGVLGVLLSYLNIGVNTTFLRAIYITILASWLLV